MKLYTIQLLLAIEMPYKSGHNKTKIILYTRFGKDRVVQSLHIFTFYRSCFLSKKYIKIAFIILRLIKTKYKSYIPSTFETIYAQ